MDRPRAREDRGRDADIFNITSSSPAPHHNLTLLTAQERDRVRIEFYATYDVMTGVRIAATLGGFFALMVFLVVYKSRSKTLKALRDPKLVELAEAVVAEEEAVEEERQLTAALECALAERTRTRASLCEVPRFVHAAPRFASIGGGYGSLIAPPRRLSGLRGDSLPTSTLRFESRMFTEEPECYDRRPPGVRDRRFSSVTCSSSGSSYLERRGSSVVCALPERRLSPCVSEHDSIEHMAPLASVCSFGPSFAVECELASVGTDSVFGEEEEDASTDGEVEQFSTDSGGGGDASARTRRVDSTEMSIRTVVSSPVDLDCANRSRETLF